jgi:acyl carrier protein
MDDIADVIIEMMIEKLEIPAQNISLTAEYESMELDSLSLVQLAVLLEKRYGVSVEDWEIAAEKTIENTVRLLHDKGVPS